jgi:hypothetical protein
MTPTRSMLQLLSVISTIRHDSRMITLRTLKATYPNHAYPVKHKLKECTMIKKNYMTSGALAKGKKP